MAGHVSDAVIRRLPGYYRHLRELEAMGVTSISSQELGERMKLKGHIGEILGLDQQHRLIILGAGNIGCAVAQYPTFSREGFKTIALFDTQENKVGRSLGDIPVKHMDTLEDFIRENMVDIAVLALPKRHAQEALHRLYDCGVRAIWNFAPTDLNHPEDMLVVNVHLSDSLQQLSYRMAHRNDP